MSRQFVVTGLPAGGEEHGRLAPQRRTPEIFQGKSWKMNPKADQKRWLFLLFFHALPFLLVTACAQQGNLRPGGMSQSNTYGNLAYAPTQYYPPPGPPDDPWGPYIREAASRYNVPEQWIRSVMAQEFGGQEQAVSSVGAMGLMQVMPGTYEELREEDGLGQDPFNPEDNILAGTAYIREMYDRYGAPAFLAAYNAGPADLDYYLAGNGDLPTETINYLAAVAPNLGNSIPMTGPLAVYASASGAETTPVTAPSAASFAMGCDVNAAYDPDHPCSAVQTPAAVVPAAKQIQAVQTASAGVCNADAAYDPDSPCTSAPGGSAAAGSCDADMAYNPDSPCTPANETAPAPIRVADTGPEAERPVPASQAATIAGSALYQPVSNPPAQPDQITASVSVAQPTPPLSPSASGGNWAVQVGAFSSSGLARAVAEGARAEAPAELGVATISLPATTRFGGLVLYRARLTNLSAAAAANACATLNGRQLPCIVVPASSA